VLGVALIVNGCGSSTVTPNPSGQALGRPSPAASKDVLPSSTPQATARTTPPPGTVTSFTTQTLTEGNRLLTLEFVGGKLFSALDHCSRAYAGWAEAVGDQLEVAVIDVTPPLILPNGGTPPGCDAIGYERTVTVHLAEPFVGARVHDLAGYLHFLRAPEGLVTLSGLPAGWLLRSERDVEDSPTGRWQRTYSPVANPDTGTSKGKIDLYQSFGGPVNVTGGDQQGTVTVNGGSATLYRFAPDGELVLVWPLGSDELALVANETDFPIDRLIILAESAR
jgi:hypothetical protein